MLVCDGKGEAKIMTSPEELEKEPLLTKRYRIVIKAFLDRDSFVDTNSPDFFDQFKDSLEDRLDHCGLLKETIVLEIMEIKK